MTGAEKLKYYRLIHKMTQKDLGNKSGIGEATIRKYELGIRNPKPAQLQKIAEAMAIPSGVLIDDNTNKANYSTVADVLFALFMLDRQTKITILGERNEDDKLKADTISLQFNNDYLNELISDWELIKTAYGIDHEEYKHLENEVLGKKFTGDIETLEKAEKYMNLSNAEFERNKYEMLLISQGNIALEETNNE
jgi:transcriptional regulator with XRE-family HTH domain